MRVRGGEDRGCRPLVRARRRCTVVREIGQVRGGGHVTWLLTAATMGLRVLAISCQSTRNWSEYTSATLYSYYSNNRCPLPKLRTGLVLHLLNIGADCLVCWYRGTTPRLRVHVPEKARPEPVRTIAPVSLSASTRRNASLSSANNARSVLGGG